MNCPARSRLRQHRWLLLLCLLAGPLAAWEWSLEVSDVPALHRCLNQELQAPWWHRLPSLLNARTQAALSDWEQRSAASWSEVISQAQSLSVDWREGQQQVHIDFKAESRLRQRIWSGLSEQMDTWDASEGPSPKIAVEGHWFFLRPQGIGFARSRPQSPQTETEGDRSAALTFKLHGPGWQAQGQSSLKGEAGLQITGHVSLQSAAVASRPPGRGLAAMPWQRVPQDSALVLGASLAEDTASPLLDLLDHIVVRKRLSAVGAGWAQLQGSLALIAGLNPHPSLSLGIPVSDQGRSLLEQLLKHPLPDLSLLDSGQTLAVGAATQPAWWLCSDGSQYWLSSDQVLATHLAGQALVPSLVGLNWPTESQFGLAVNPAYAEGLLQHWGRQQASQASANAAVPSFYLPSIFLLLDLIDLLCWSEPCPSSPPQASSIEDWVHCSVSPDPESRESWRFQVKRPTPLLLAFFAQWQQEHSAQQAFGQDQGRENLQALYEQLLLWLDDHESWPTPEQLSFDRRQIAYLRPLQAADEYTLIAIDNPAAYGHLGSWLLFADGSILWHQGRDLFRLARQRARVLATGHLPRESWILNQSLINELRQQHQGE